MPLAHLTALVNPRLVLQRIYARARVSEASRAQGILKMQRAKSVMIRGPYGVDILDLDGRVVGFIELRKALLSPPTWFQRGLGATVLTDKQARTSAPALIRLWDSERGWYTLAHEFSTLKEMMDWYIERR